MLGRLSASFSLLHSLRVHFRRTATVSQTLSSHIGRPSEARTIAPGRPQSPTARCRASAQTCGSAATMAKQTYTPQPLPGSPFGMEVRDFSLTLPLDPETIERIKADVAKHQILVFRGQGKMNGEDQVRISSWFGELESTFYKHPQSPHPDVFRVSNDRQHGCTGVGRTGWHIDGSFMEKPFSHSIYHIWSVPKAGATIFASLYHMVEALPEEVRRKWDRLWPISDRRSGVVHPLIYPHLETGRETMCFHTGMIDTFSWDNDTPQQRTATPLETVQILDEIDGAFRGPLGQRVQYEHVWKPGDFIISDNLSVAHEAHPSTQLPVSKVGLRVMHRCTIAGKYEPAKQYEDRARA